MEKLISKLDMAVIKAKTALILGFRVEISASIFL